MASYRRLLPRLRGHRTARVSLPARGRGPPGHRTEPLGRRSPDFAAARIAPTPSIYETLSYATNGATFSPRGPKTPETGSADRQGYPDAARRPQLAPRAATRGDALGRARLRRPQVAITHPDKVFFPEPGYTNSTWRSTTSGGDVPCAASTAAPGPQTLVDGASGEPFFQKRALSKLPPAIETARILFQRPAPPTWSLRRPVTSCGSSIWAAST